MRARIMTSVPGEDTAIGPRLVMQGAARFSQLRSQAGARRGKTGAVVATGLSLSGLKEAELGVRPKGGNRKADSGAVDVRAHDGAAALVSERLTYERSGFRDRHFRG